MLLSSILFLLINVEYVSFYYVFWGKRPNGTYDRKMFISVCISALLLVISVTIGQGTILCIAALLSAMIIIMSMYHLTISETVRLFLTSFLMVSILESIIEFILRYGIQLDERYVAIVDTGIITYVMWMYYVLIGRKIDKDAFLLTTKMNFVVACALFAIEAMISYFTFMIIEVVLVEKEMIGLGLVIAGGGVIVILILLMIYYFNEQNKYQLENAVLETFNEQQRDYFEQLLKKEQGTRQFRHDIIAELMQIKNFCAKEEYAELEAYVEEMLRDISAISKYDYDVGNEIINIILNYYLLPIKDKCKIEVRGYISDSLDISGRDLCILVSNLIKNAVEAVVQVTDAEKYIFFEIKCGKLYLQMNMKNTCLEENGNIEDGKILTTKKDKENHGFGLKNIENTVRKYEGEATYRKENGYFVSEIRIKNNRSSIN